MAEDNTTEAVDDSGSLVAVDYAGSDDAASDYAGSDDAGPDYAASSVVGGVSGTVVVVAYDGGGGSCTAQLPEMMSRMRS